MAKKISRYIFGKMEPEEIFKITGIYIPSGLHLDELLSSRKLVNL